MAAGNAELPEDFRFPDRFLWGAATSSHQVEGGNTANDWWECEQAGRLPQRSGDACRHYELFEADFDLARSLGHNAHRLSIEWSRIEPREDEWDQAALEHYAVVVEALRQRGIEPVVTLHHFTNPAWFARRGGWASAASVDLYVRYVDVVTARLAAQVRFWLTINEPTVYVKHAYVAGDWPPQMRRNGWKAARALRHMCRAHAAAYPVIHRHRPESMVGFAHSAPFVTPCDPRNPLDRLAAAARDFALNGLVFRLLGRQPRKVLDFIGVNYYARQVVRWDATSASALAFGSECRDDHHGIPRSFTSLGWENFADGLRQALRRLSRYGLPLLVTENGVATDDEGKRLRYLNDHLRALALAVHEGLPVLGYLYWTLMDNFEWAEGFDARFGLAGVDFGTQERTPRPAAEALRAVCTSNRLRGRSVGY